MESLKVSVCITVLNEGKSIGKLLKALVRQSKAPSEIVIVDAGSSDNTIEEIKKFTNTDIPIKLIIKSGVSRSKGRNLAIQKSKYNIVAITDGGCVPNKDWIEKITEPFLDMNVMVVAGFYVMKWSTDIEKLFSIYLGTLPNDFDATFLPSARSLSLRKKTWKSIGGFPENITEAGEDTVFNFKLLDKGFEIERRKDAVVVWTMPHRLRDFFNKVKGYSKGDICSQTMYHRSKGLNSHNIKMATVLLRYIALSIFLLNSFVYAFIYIGIYFIFIYLKVLKKTDDWKISFLGIPIQIVSDIAVMTGAVIGILNYT